MFYLLHGEDEFTSREQLKTLRQQGQFDFNQDVYSGADGDLKTILITCDTLPFLTEQRLVVVDGLPKKKRGEDSSEGTTEKSKKTQRSKKGGKGKTATRADFEKELAAYIPLMPDATMLIMIVDEALAATSPLVKIAATHGKAIQSTLPKGHALESWITRRAKHMGVKMAPEAVSLLGNFIGNNLRLLANEIDKLATYVGKDGTITAQNVQALSAQVKEARIFDLTDALAQRRQKQALDILHDLLADGEPPIKLISTIISQVRSLMLVKELTQQGMRSTQIASTLSMAPFIADKCIRQVKNFHTTQLENTYRQLLATDAALKRSRMTPEMALDLLVIQFGA
ncbi:MAG TPA: DNA polymerase III subunit delta [Ktedonobacteraceae bacterium]|jgi:DNA polymerase-3 subunit delta|nr:DNA polymerase III subunit delta [Ktedonobacteraceae bacterium]